MQQSTHHTLPPGSAGWPSEHVFDSGRGADNRPSAENDITFAEIAAMLWRRRFLNTAIVGVFVGAAVGVTLKMHKKYQATSEMIVLQAASPQQSLATANQSTAALLSGVTTPLIETPDTQVAMIGSPGMAQRTLDYLKNEALKQNQTLGDLGVVDNPDLLANNILAINPKGTNLLEVSVTATSPVAAQTLTNAVSEAFVKWKKEVAQSSVDEMTSNLDVRAERSRNAMLGAEKRVMDFEKKWQVVDIPEQERESLAQLYSRQSDVAALEQEASAHQTKLAALGVQLGQANRTIGVGGMVRDDTLILGLQQQLSQAQMDLTAAKRKYTPAYPGVLPDLISHVADLKTRLDRAVGTAVHGDASLQSQGALKEAYQEEQVALVSIQKKLAAATSQRDKLTADSARWPGLHNQYQRLANEAEMARTLYAGLESEVSAAKSGKDMTTGNVQITQVALLPDMPSSPKLPLNIALGFILGMVVAVASTLVKNQNDRRIHTSSDAFKLVSGPCVGTVPALTAAEMKELRGEWGEGFGRDAFGLAGVNLMLVGQAGSADPRADRAAARAARAARTHSIASMQAPAFNAQVDLDRIFPSNDDSFPRVILVTSALPGEGKSLVACELAKAIARSSRSVVVVDADLRRPTQHRLFEQKVGEGLTDLLQKTTTLDSVLGETSTPGVRLISSGSAVSRQTASPTGLLSLPLMQSVITTLTGIADVVIIDTPPSAVVPDALFLAPYADCALQVIGVEYSDSDAVRETSAALHHAAPGTVAFLVNRVPRSKDRSYKSGYGYSYAKRLPDRGAVRGVDPEPLAALAATSTAATTED